MSRSITRVAAALTVLCTLGLATPTHAAPALWVVKSRSATVYLFGSVHVLPPKFPWMDASIEQALAASDEIWTEADPVDHQGDREAMRRYGWDSKMLLIKQLPPDYRERFKAEMSHTGVSPDVYMHVRPWLADLLLTRGALRQAGFGARTGVESSLYAYARAHHKLTASFETIDEQLAIFGDLPEEEQLTALKQEIDSFSEVSGALDLLVGGWLAGDDAALDQLTNQRLQAISMRTWTDIILRRNGEFARRIADRLGDSGTIFVAIGAAHLCGSDSVQSLLQNYGFTAYRVVDKDPGAITVEIKAPRRK